MTCCPSTFSFLERIIRAHCAYLICFSPAYKVADLVKHNRDLEGDLSLAMTSNIDLAGMSDDRKTINLVGDMIK